MKCTIPEISWHNRDPVLSVDTQFCSTPSFYRLATGGTDNHVIIWQLNILDNGGVSVEMLSDLVRHNRAVNAVRFAPNGQILASSDDEAAIILWQKNEDSSNIFIEESEKDNKEHWSIYKMLRCHIEDVYDLCWSSCSQFLISGSVDNSAILWDIQKGKANGILKDHKGFVQGVAWDPKGQIVATLSSDRFLRIYNISTKKVTHRIFKASVIGETSMEEELKTSKLFYDDTLKSFCRRLSFSPDGQMLLAPSGIMEDSNGKCTNGTYLFLRSCLSRPVTFYPTHEKYTIAVRFCPKLFELRRLKNAEDMVNSSYMDLFNLPYRMVFAVATQNAVLIYDTQQSIPFAKVSNIHYTRLSDLSWSSDGRILIVSSTDGYCSLMSFSEGELGTPYFPNENLSDKLAETSFYEKDSSSDFVDQEEQFTSIQSNEGKLADDARITAEERLGVSENDLKTLSTGKESLDIENKSPKHQQPPSDSKIAKPIAVKRKPGKRVELITLSRSVGEKPTAADSTVKEVDPNNPLGRSSTKLNDCQKGSVESSSNNRTPRRVSLITLSSPKCKKSPSG